MGETPFAVILIMAAVCATLLAYAGVGKLRGWAQGGCWISPTAAVRIPFQPRGGVLIIVLSSLLGVWLALLLVPSSFPTRIVFPYSLGATLIALESVG